MIWVILTFLGVPLWLCVGALLVLLRGRRQITHLPDGFASKPRVVSGHVRGLEPDFARISSVGHWVHKVLVLHGGNPFLTQTILCGITSIVSGPADIDPATVKRIDDPVAVRFLHDAGGTVEVVCSRGDLTALLGPFSAPMRPTDSPAAPVPPTGKKTQ
ncbi:MAG: hypothetical protein WAW17_11395 [Rhodococcus sp. (in: high G+C Gram-positive bacteria)]|uniref:hypothetical protein n=1 Tax=Rhodococcus sp. TaxID=1831 RepID=UPI003BB00012